MPRGKRVETPPALPHPPSGASLTAQGTLGKGPGISYLHGRGQLHTLVMLQVGRGRHQGEAVLVLHPCQLLRVLSQSC